MFLGGYSYVHTSSSRIVRLIVYHIEVTEMSEKETGQAAYELYGRNAGWKTYDGRDMPSWRADPADPHSRELNDAVRANWAAVEIGLLEQREKPVKGIPGLTEGRIVHFVTPWNTHRPGIIAEVNNPIEGHVSLWMFPSRDEVDPRASVMGPMYVEGTTYSKEPLPGTWHWIEPA